MPNSIPATPQRSTSASSEPRGLPEPEQQADSSPSAARSAADSPPPPPAAAMSADTSLPPLIAAQLNYLLSHSPLSIQVDQIRSGCKFPRYNDRFALYVPFCLDYIRWDIVYNALYPSAAPDIVFSAEDEGFHPFALAAEGGGDAFESSLCDWNSKDPTRLLALVHEIRELYALYQRKRVAEIDDARLKFELSTILAREGIEVCLMSGPDRVEEVKFTVPLLDMDLNKLVPGCPWKNQQNVHLQVVFPVSRQYSTTPSAPRIKLVSSSDLKTLFSVEDVKLPPWLDGMCMAEYLPILEDNLKVQVIEAVASIGERRRFIEALAQIFGRPIEADPIFCRRATILSVSGTFGFLVHFSIPTQFPKQQPILSLQSCQHFNGQLAPITSPPVNEYPWSPRWDVSKMAERIFDFLVDECLNFKKYCNDAIP